jgi:hydrogenase nickel incorporation protein HypA/HybF
MHEMSLLQNLMDEILALARRHDAKSVSLIRLKIGAQTRISPDHLREHFTTAARGTVAQDAMLDVVEDTDPTAGLDIILESVELER